MARSHEVPLRYRIPLAVVGGAAVLAACAAPAAEPPEPAATTPEPGISDINGFQPIIKYYPNGTRSIRLEILNANGNPVYNNRSALEFCDGLDLVGIGEAWYVDTSGSIERSVGHAACLDGRLTPTDFEQ